MHLNDDCLHSILEQACVCSLFSMRQTCKRIKCLSETQFCIRSASKTWNQFLHKQRVYLFKQKKCPFKVYDTVTYNGVECMVIEIDNERIRLDTLRTDSIISYVTIEWTSLLRFIDFETYIKYCCFDLVTDIIKSKKILAISKAFESKVK